MKVIGYRENFTRNGHTVGCRREQRKLHRPAEGQIEFAAADLHLPAFFMTPRNEAKRFRFVFAFQTDIERMRCAAADPAAHSAADQRVVRSSTGYRQLQRTVLKNPHRSFGPIPERNRFDEPFPNAYRIAYP